MTENENTTPVEWIFTEEFPEGEDKADYLEIVFQASMKEDKEHPKKITSYRKASIWYKTGQTLADLVKIQGSEELVRDLALGFLKIKVQALGRQDLEAGRDVIGLKNWVHGDVRERLSRDPVSLGDAAFERMTKEEQIAFIERMSERLTA